ncbi:amidohydrolase family protein [Actinomyces faecalis]|uniref:amidohydrolase family protein n=1 Tax=Actinomyces faecalis TaxID=2722820 RepID=UPI001555D126|nr:amidohydrolase family protein [Actinomyces faecalis]
MTTYNGPVIDAHHHFWEPSLGKQPWLLPGVDIGFRYGPYESIKRDYLPPDIIKDASTAGINLVGTVTMETEWEEDDPIGEMEYTANISKKYGLPNAAVAHALLHHPDVEQTLEELSNIPLVRGVRHKPGQAPSPKMAAQYKTLMTDSAWLHGISLLRKYGLSFDLQVAWWHLDQAEEMLRKNPELPVIINHAALPSDRSEDALTAWQEATARISQFPQVTIKVSGIGLQGIAWTANNNRRIVEHLATSFGPDRMMFASNFPVDSLTASYSEIWNGFLEIVKDYSPTEQKKMFAGTAQHVYRLPPELLTE